MSGYGSVAATRRAFYLLTALRWLPTGLMIPILVLFMTSRGLTLAEVGLVSATQAAVVVILELPTGGLADALGRRPLLAVASVVAVISGCATLAADSLLLFALAWTLNGIYRALDSGPLEAWYVDAALAVEPDRNLERDLSGAGAVLYASIAAGALLASGITLVDGLPTDPLTAVVAASVLLEAVHLVGVLVLVREVRPARGIRAAWFAAKQAPHVVADGIRLGWGHRSLRLLLAVELSWGAGLTAVEILWQPHTQDALGAAEQTWLFGVMGSAGWVAGALGALLLPGLVRLMRGRVGWAAALMRLMQGAATVALGLSGGVVGVMTGYIVFYAIHGAANPAHFALLHRRVDAARRATVLSMNSLIARISGLPAAIAFGALATGVGTQITLVIAGLLIASAAPLYLAATRRADAAGSVPAIDALRA